MKFFLSTILFFFIESLLPAQSPAPLEIHIQVTHPTCAGKCDGTVKVTVTGGQPGYMYFWSNGSRAENYYDACAGTGEIVVKDIAGNVATGAYSVIDPLPIGIDKLITKQPTAGHNDGWIEIQISGGLLPYQFSLDGEKYSTSNEFYNLASGSYVINIKDSNGCLVQSSTIVLDRVMRTSDLKTAYHMNFNNENRSIHLYANFPLKIKLTDLQGRVFQKEDFNTSHDINLDNLDYGVYFLKISDGVRNSYERIVKIK